jgi:HD-GYP domain-containing protein (c-di-GMP phosphodiesterase class II)
LEKSHKQKHILVADPDEVFLGRISADPRAPLITPLLTKNGKEAQLVLADKEKRLLAMILSSRIQDTSWLSVLRARSVHRPGLPIYLILEDGTPQELTSEEFKKLGITEVIQRPLTYGTIVDKVSPNIVVFDHRPKADSDQQNAIQVGEEFIAADEKYVPILAEDFLSGTVTFFNLFIRLGTGKFVKIINTGESFEHKRLLNYLEKGVKHFYIDIEEQARYVAYCDKVASSLISNKKFSVELQSKRVMVHGEEAMNYLKSRGLTAETIQYAASFIANVEILVKRIDRKNNSFIKTFSQDLVKYEHGAATTIIASLLAKHLKFQNERTIEIVGIASLFHDIGLVKLNMDCTFEDEPDPPDEKRKIYETHPLLSGEILSQLPDIDPVVIQAVTQHHERRSRKGYPNHLGPGERKLFCVNRPV